MKSIVSVNTAKSLVHAAGRKYIEAICRSDFDNQSVTRYNERPLEYRFALEHLSALDPAARTVCDIGTGTTAWPALLRTCGFAVTAVDNVSDYWTEEMINRHWLVI